MARDAPESPAIVLTTDRLVLRHLTLDDDAFIVALLNDPGWLRFIGDKGVRTREDARNYLAKGPLAMYQRHGFGLYMVELADGQVPIGMCGLIKRDTLDDVDIGYAFLPAFRAQGYAHEAASAVLAHGKRRFGLTRIVAITSPDNAGSARLLEKLGMTLEKTVTLAGADHEVRLYASGA